MNIENKFLHIDSLEEVLKDSESKRVLILKHSNTCPISAGAYSRIVEGLEGGTITNPTYLLIVQEQRDLSNEIAEVLNVVHQSPQLILVKGSKAIYDASHGGIQIEGIPVDK